ncbi:MAG TPA: DUF6527 family protein [Sideroxyarcus sp.]|nr:DUF6527 family protein [Sideroxyarcus sp.]
MFFCPGCECYHRIQYGEGNGPRWGWNGDAEKPTFTPSILVRGTKMTDKGEAAYEEWRAAGFPKPAPEKFDSVDTVCHSFVTEGRIQFLGDCTHALAGQTVDIPDFDQ